MIYHTSKLLHVAKQHTVFALSHFTTKIPTTSHSLPHTIFFMLAGWLAGWGLQFTYIHIPLLMQANK
jgi:hypothetical protein